LLDAGNRTIERRDGLVTARANIPSSVEQSVSAACNFVCNARPHQDTKVKFLESGRLERPVESQAGTASSVTASAFPSEKLPRSRADDPSPGQDAWMRFLEVPGPWDKPLTSPHTLSWTQEAAPVEGKGVHGLRPMKGPLRTLDRNPGR
jgi:hypothetical protein